MFELKPCPFCGGEAEIVTGVTNITPRHGKVHIKCSSCGACSDTYYDSDYNGEYILKVINAWNTRHYEVEEEE